MNKLTRKEFASLMGKKPDWIRTYISRNKVVEDSNRLIDTDLDINKSFLVKWGVEKIERSGISEETVVLKKEKPKVQDIAKEVDRDGKINPSNIDYVIKQHDLKLKQVKIKKEALDLKKKEAKIIDLITAEEIMQRVVIILSNGYRLKSKTYINNLASKYKIPRKAIASIQKEFDESINKAVREASESIELECRAVANEMAGQFNVGERKN